MTTYKQYSLARYTGPSTKRICPNCHQKTFKPYVDEWGVPFSNDFQSADESIRSLAETVGRCDNERKCGHHYTPKMFFQDTKTGVPQHREGYKPPPPPKRAKPLDFDLVRRSFKPYHSTFVQYLRDVAKFPAERLERVLQDYWVGASNNGWIAYWFINADGECVDGKFMCYKPDGHRNHDVWPFWARKKIITSYFKAGRISEAKKNELLDEWVPRGYFGEHLLSDPRYKDKPVAFVEGEKSCLICSIMYPRFLWMASGGNGINKARLQKAIFQRRKIYFFPDVDQVEKWRGKIAELGYKDVVFKDEYVLSQAQSEKDDIGDIALREWMSDSDESAIEEGKTEGDASGTVATLPTADAVGTVAETSGKALGTVATVAEEPEWTEDDEKAYRQNQLELVFEILGIEAPHDGLTFLYERLDLEVVSEEIIDDPDYEGF